MKIIWLLRPRNKIGISIEGVFSALATDLSSKIPVEILDLPGEGKLKLDVWKQRRFVQRLSNTELHHMLGDVHYLALWIRGLQVHTYHDLESLFTGNKLIRSLKWIFWLKIPAKKSLAFSCISEHTGKTLSRVLKGKHPPITVIPNPLLLPVLSRGDLPMGFSNSERQYLSIGTKTNKNLERIASALIKRKNYTWHIVGDMSSDQEKYFSSLGISFKSYHNLNNDDLVSLYRSVDVLLFPSLFEGFGLPIIEAQANGVVVVTSNLTAMPETAGNGALLVDPYSVESISKAMDKLETTPELVSDLIIKGWENSQQYSIERIAQKYLDWYKSVLGANA